MLAPTQERITLAIQSNALQEGSQVHLQPTAGWGDSVLDALRYWSVPALRLTLGLVFLWFGALKVFGVSPVTPMLREAYSFMALPAFIVLLGGWEMLIGIGLIFKVALPYTLCLMCLHLAGTFAALALAPSYFFLHGNPLLLTVNGEFVVKNVVLLTAGLVIGSNELSHLSKRVEPAQTSLYGRSSEAVGEGATSQI
jgi:putative oxidoreductase